MAENRSEAMAGEILQRQEKLAHDRGTWESHWQEIAERVIPRHARLFNTTQPAFNTKGEKRTQEMVDATAALALERFAAVMESMLTPRNAKWHMLTPTDPVLRKQRRVADWFEEANRRLFQYRYAPRANFAGQNHENFIGLGAYGSGSMFVDASDRSPGLRYKAIPLNEMFFLENHQGLIDTAFRRFTLTARQAYQRWGDRLPDQVLGKLEKNPEEPFEFVHMVEPNDNPDPDRKDREGMPFKSYYISVTGKQMISEGGYWSFPYAVSRYVTAPGEVYGRSPAMLALPSIKTLNEQKKSVLKQGHRATDPVILTADDGVLDNFSLKPGAINPGSVTQDGRVLVSTLPTGNLAVGFEMMEQERAVINDAFLVSLFQILTETPAMTATEVLERTREKGMLLSPTMGRQQSEMLGPMIEREIDILMRQGLLPELPPELIEAQGDYEVIYDSPLSRAQRSEEASGLYRYMEWAGNYVQLTGDPSPFDHISVDRTAPELLAIHAVPLKWQASGEEIMARRQARSQAAQQQQAIEAAPAMAGLAKAQQGG